MIRVASFYQFHDLPEAQLDSVKSELTIWAKDNQLFGLVILGKEGMNGTIAGLETTVQEFIQKVSGYLNREVELKWSASPTVPFRRFKIKIRKEIVTIGNEQLVPSQGEDSYLEPSQWQKVLETDPDAVVLDTRNWYETKIGKFKGAIDPQIKEFREFGDYLEKANLPKDKKYLIYCTGGIRCEKAILEMNRQGFDEVYQLKGGILKYLEEFPEKNFDGECFVFDNRVAVDQNLQPTQSYKLCPHCGQPGSIKIDCKFCGVEGVVCEICQPTEHLQTCSKNCAHHVRLGHKFKRRHEDSHRPPPQIVQDFPSRTTSGS